MAKEEKAGRLECDDIGKRTRVEPLVVDDNTMFSKDHFVVPLHYKEYVEGVLIPAGLIRDRIARLARDIRARHPDQVLHLVCLLKGGSAFFNDLQQSLREMALVAGEHAVPFTMDFLRAKSYDGTESTGNVRIGEFDLASIEGKHVILCEDIVDTGNTMAALIPFLLRNSNPASLEVACLLEKRHDRGTGFKADYVGFSVPDKFIVGYALDYNDYFRDMASICVLNDAGIAHFSR